MPRIKNSEYCHNDIYKDYLSDKEEDSPYYVSSKDFAKYTNEFYIKLMELVILKSKVINLPFKFGEIYVGKKKPVQLTTNMSVDWETSKKIGKWVRFDNSHSSGWKFRFLWVKRKSYVINAMAYRLIFSRDNKRLLAKTIKEGRDYLEMKK